MKPQGMVDIEALSSAPDAAVIAIGLCVFDAKDIIDSTQILIDPELAPGHRDPETILWWESQDPDVYSKMTSGDWTPWDACDEMSLFLEEHRVKHLWANAPTYDISILRYLFGLYNKKFPIHFSKELDYRTLKHFAKGMSIEFSEPLRERTAHDAESDAIAQAKTLQIILEGLALV